MKKTYKYIIEITIIIILCGIALLTIRKNVSNPQNENNETENIQKQPDYVIKSTDDRPISKDDVEATNIEIIETSSTLEVKTTIKNNSDKDIKGFFIVIDLLDKNGKKVTSIAKNSKDEIPSKGSYVLTSSIVGMNEVKNVKTAKIVTLEKDTESAMKDSFDKITESTEP